MVWRGLDTSCYFSIDRNIGHILNNFVNVNHSRAVLSYGAILHIREE